MTNFGRILGTAALAIAACGLASANTVGYEATGGTGLSAQATDFNYSLTGLKDFNPGSGGIPATAVLTGVELILFGSETATSVSITNLGATAQSSFNVEIQSQIANNTTAPLVDSATSADVFNGVTLTTANITISTLGGDVSPTNVACPTGTPSASCDSVMYGAQPAATTQNNTEPFAVITGVAGLTGIGQSDTANLSHYIGSGTFSLTGSTNGVTTLSGAGSVAGAAIATGFLNAEVDYTYTVPSTTPEPGTIALMGSALLGLGLLRRKRNGNA